MTEMRPETARGEIVCPLTKISAHRLQLNDASVKLVALLINMNVQKRFLMTICRSKRGLDEIEHFMKK